MFIIYNKDGSIKKKNFAEFIQKGNNNANFIFVGIDGLDLTDYSCYATFELPTEELGGPVAGVPIVEFSEELPYSGYNIPVTAEMTQYEGQVKLSLHIENSQGAEMYTYPVTLVINDATSAPDQTKINLSQYQALLNLVNSKAVPTSNLFFTVVDDISAIPEEEWELYSVGKIFYDKETNAYYIKTASGYDYYTKTLPVIDIATSELYSMKYGQFKEKYKNAFDSNGRCRCVLVKDSRDLYVAEFGAYSPSQTYLYYFDTQGNYYEVTEFNDNTQMYQLMSTSNKLRRAIRCLLNGNSTTLKAIIQPYNQDPVFLTLNGIEFIVRQPIAGVNRYLFLGQSDTGIIKSFVKEGTFTNFTTQEIIDAFNNAPEIVLNSSNQTISGQKDFTNANGIKTNIVRPSGSSSTVSLYSGTGKVVDADVGGFIIYSHTYPNSDATYDLGKPSTGLLSPRKAFRNLYLAGNLDDGNGNAITIADIASKTYVDNLVSGAVHFKGTVADLTTLNAIQNPAQGDMYWVTSESSYYIWNGSAWSQTGGGVDLSNYYNKTESAQTFVDFIHDQTISGVKTFTNGIKIEDSTVGCYSQIVPGANSLDFYFKETSGTLEKLFSLYANVQAGQTTTYHAIFDTDTVRPSYDGQYAGDLGSSNYRWKDLYLSGNLVNGNKSVSISEIYDKVHETSGSPIISISNGVSGIISSGTFTQAQKDILNSNDSVIIDVSTETQMHFYFRKQRTYGTVQLFFCVVSDYANKLQVYRLYTQTNDLAWSIIETTLPQSTTQTSITIESGDSGTLTDEQASILLNAGAEAKIAYGGANAKIYLSLERTDVYSSSTVATFSYTNIFYSAQYGKYRYEKTTIAADLTTNKAWSKTVTSFNIG